MRLSIIAPVAMLWAASSAHATEPAQTANSATALPDGPIAAVWREHRVNFHYFGRTSLYSCDGLRDKVRALLIELGARRDLRITTAGCIDLRFPNPSAGLSIVFSVPTLASRQLAAARPGDLAPVEARYSAFTLTRDAFRNLDVGDCELIEEFAQQLLPKLSTRNVTQKITCVPHQLSGNSFLVRGLVLKAAMPRD
jgi:hypothetical protein